MKKIKKEYIAPSVDIHAFNFESMLMAGTVVNESKGDDLPTIGVTGAGGDGGGDDDEAGSKFNSGMSWDEEE